MTDALKITDSRPKTSERITITDLGVKRANPTPRVVEEVDILLEEYLSPRKLKALTGMDDLTKVKCLQLKVDTTETSLGNFGAFLPNLQELKIKDGIVASIRDLGSSLCNLQILWMPRCSLQEIDGISAMENLAELYLAYNDVTELSALTMLEHLRLLDLEGNNIDDLKQVEYLACCGKLSTLTLDGNPVVISEKKERGLAEYRQIIKKIIPQLRYLDDVQLTDKVDDLNSKAPNAFEEDWNYINTFILSENPASDSPNAPLVAQSIEASGRPSSTTSSRSSLHTPLPRPTTGYRPGSALKPTTADKHLQLALQRSSSNQSYPQTARPPSTAGRRPQSEDLNLMKETASELTMGDVVCGNPAKSLRTKLRSARGNQSPTMPFSPDFAHLSASSRRQDSSAAPIAVADDSLLDEHTRSLFEEALTFRKEHEKTMKVIAQDRAPQVLKIDFDEDARLDLADFSRSASEEDIDADEVHVVSSSSRGSDLTKRSRNSSSPSLPPPSVRGLPPPASPAGALNPLKVPTPPRRATQPRARPLFPNEKSKPMYIPPPVESPLRSPSQANKLLPSKFAITK